MISVGTINPAVEARRREGERQCARLLIGDLVCEPDPPRQRSSDGDVVRGQIDADDATTQLVREIARRAAETASDVEEFEAGAHAHLAGEPMVAARPPM